ncbi:interferon gamma receptor 2 isoform X2 [Rana temporaria]|uniref:interferon gamma receptor 2 isoform X2 n=1 Tax=Rana temporaria TaxID=8407 RepID=UPI001AAD8551|nr:interferon gamma receptor 2 isoform X2 [Rana temporaria]
MPPALLVLIPALITVLPAVLSSNTEPGLPAPSNVHIDSYNMKHIVRWDPVEVKDESMPVMYSVRFELYMDFRELCVNITETECDFTEKIESFWRGRMKVRAELGSRRSEWVVLPNFQPSKNTIIGPVKSLGLNSHSGNLAVDFSPPFSPIPDVLVIYYNLSYWKEDSEEKKTVDLHSSMTYVLDNLERNTNYCVQVYAYTRSIKGLMSDSVCEKTVTDYTLTVVLVCAFGVVLIFVVISLSVIPDKPLHKALSGIKDWLDGPYRIPPHVINYLVENPSPLVHEESTRHILEEQQCDHISIVEMDLYQDDHEEMPPDHSQSDSENT